MSCSKPVPPFVLDLLYYLNRDQLEHFSIVCRPMKNFIDRYFHAKPYRIFDELRVLGGLYALRHNYVQWHPNRGDYSAQQFLARQECDRNAYYSVYEYYSFAEMRPYLGPTVRIKRTWIGLDEDFTYNSQHVAEMESISYLWRDGRICIDIAEGSQLILNSPTVLQCRELSIDFHGNEYFSLKDYKVLYSVNKMEIAYYNEKTDPNIWPQFLEQPGAKPVVVLLELHPESINEILDQLTQTFSSAVSPNPFKIVFAELDEELSEFRETNNTSGEILEMKKGLPVDYQTNYYYQPYNYTLERSSALVL